MKLLYVFPILVGLGACGEKTTDMDIKVDGTNAWAYSGHMLCSVYDNIYASGNGWLNFEDSVQPCTDAKLSPGEWAVQFSYGIVKGESVCSAKSGDKQEFTYDKNKSSEWSANEDILKTTDGVKRYCWCKPYGIYDTVTDTTPKSLLGSSDNWVFVFDSDDYACDDVCAGYCATAALFYADFRRASFGSAN